MSDWTHVAGVIRVNQIKLDEHVPDLNFEELIGKEVRFSDESDIWADARKHPEKYLPMGSEGSLRMSVWTNPDISHVARYTVSIFGDLRDYDTPETIIEWFKKKCEDEELSVRDAVISARCNSQESLTWTYSGQ